MKKITCRVCNRVCDIMNKDSEDFVCSVCCDLNITDKNELQDFLEEQKDFIKVPIYWAEIDGEKVIDEEGMTEEFRNQLNQLIEDEGGERI